MQVSVETLRSLERRIKVAVPAEQIKEEMAKRLRKIASTAKLDGFRPGKAPLPVIERQFGESVKHEAIDAVINKSFHEAIVQEKLSPAGDPQIEPLNFKLDGPLEYAATFEVYPEIKLADLSGLKIEKIVASVGEHDVDVVIEGLRKQYPVWKSVDRAAKTGDQLTINFEGTMDDKPLEGGSGEKVQLILGSNRFIPGFEEGLVGSKVGRDVNLDLSFPKEYHEKDLAGKAVKFVVKVLEISEPELPALDDAFVRRFGIREGGVAEMKKQTQKTMETSLTQALKAKIKQQVMDKILERNPIEVPKALINAEARHLQQQAVQQFRQKTGYKGALPEVPADSFNEEAKRRVSLSLLLGEVIQKEKLEVDEGKVKEMLTEIASSYDNPPEVIAWYQGNKEKLLGVQSLVLEDQVVEKLLEKAKLVEKPSTYAEVMDIKSTDTDIIKE
jgi:trigger factor